MKKHLWEDLAALSQFVFFRFLRFEERSNSEVKGKPEIPPVVTPVLPQSDFKFLVDLPRY